MRVNIRWRSGDRAGRARPAAAGPQNHRQTIAPLGRMLLSLATVLGLTGCSYVLGHAVSEIVRTGYIVNIRSDTSLTHCQMC